MEVSISTVSGNDVAIKINKLVVKYRMNLCNNGMNTIFKTFNIVCYLSCMIQQRQKK